MADIDAKEVANIENQTHGDDVVAVADKVVADDAENSNSNSDENADKGGTEAGDAAEDAQENESSRKRKSITVVSDEGDSKKAKTDEVAEVPASNGVEETTKTADDVVQRLENEEEVAA